MTEGGHIKTLRDLRSSHLRFNTHCSRAKSWPPVVNFVVVTSQKVNNKSSLFTIIYIKFTKTPTEAILPKDYAIIQWY